MTPSALCAHGCVLRNCREQICFCGKIKQKMVVAPSSWPALPCSFIGCWRFSKLRASTALGPKKVMKITRLRQRAWLQPLQLTPLTPLTPLTLAASRYPLVNGFNKPENGFSHHETTETAGKSGKSEPKWDIRASVLLEDFGNLPG